MAGGVDDRDLGWRAAIRRLGTMAAGKHVVVGIRSAKGSAVAPGDTINLAGIAAVHEFGSSDGRVPERSYLRSTFDRNVQKYGEHLEASLGRVVDGRTTIDAELELLGVRVAGDVQAYIAEGSGPPPKLADATIKRKKSSHALQDTRRLTQSIDSEVRED